MIRFTEETIREAETAFVLAPGTRHDCLHAAAAVFEAAANAQAQPVNVVFEGPPGPEAPRFIEVEDAQAERRSDAPAVPEPFMVGKRYRTRGAGVADVYWLSKGETLMGVRYADGARYWLNRDGLFPVCGGSNPRDLLPGAIDDEPAHKIRAGLEEALAFARGEPNEVKVHEPARSAITDEEFGHQLFYAYGGECTEVEGWTTVARRARELLQPELAEWKRAVEVESDVSREFQSRTERAEAAIERARSEIEATLRIAGKDAYGRGFDEALRACAAALGLTIMPARELAVVWEGTK